MALAHPLPPINAPAAAQRRSTECVGNDGLTDSERAASARRFRETKGAPLTRAEGDAIRAWRERKREQSRLA